MVHVMRTTLTLAAVATFALATFPGCRQENKDPLTAGEARTALEEASMSAQAASVMSGSIEISTDFTIGGAVEDAAQEIRDYVESQLPCAEVVLDEHTLSIEYGVKPGNCTYRGHTYSGSHVITVERNDMGEVVVDHEWDQLSNGVVSVTGAANVEWSFDDETRHVVHELTWTRLSDGRTGIGSGDRIQRPLPGGLVEGFQVDGERCWQGENGEWELGIDGVQMRWQDPVPQAGTYVLTTPNDKTLSMSFNRIDEDTIEVNLENGKRSFSFNVNSIGLITDAAQNEDNS
jgi:hypothetical protein